MKFLSVVLLLFLLFPYSPMDKIAALFTTGKAYLSSESISSTAVLIGTGLIGLIGISRKF